jgi:hypothetical protein
MDKQDLTCARYPRLLEVRAADYLTNSSLRERFGIDEQNRAMASRLIKDATKAWLIVPHHAKASP